MPKSCLPSNALVVALAYDGLCAFEFGIVAEIFGLPRPEMGEDWYRFAVCAEHPGRLTTNVGVTVEVDAGLDLLEQAGTIIIPGWRSDGVAPSTGLAAALLDAHARGVRLVTIC